MGERGNGDLLKPDCTRNRKEYAELAGVGHSTGDVSSMKGCSWFPSLLLAIYLIQMCVWCRPDPDVLLCTKVFHRLLPSSVCSMCNCDNQWFPWRRLKKEKKREKNREDYAQFNPRIERGRTCWGWVRVRPSNWDNFNVNTKQYCGESVKEFGWE
jgi:hypothetical protein